MIPTACYCEHPAADHRRAVHLRVSDSGGWWKGALLCVNEVPHACPTCGHEELRGCGCTYVDGESAYLSQDAFAAAPVTDGGTP